MLSQTQHKLLPSGCLSILLRHFPFSSVSDFNPIDLFRQLDSFSSNQTQHQVTKHNTKLPRSVLTNFDSLLMHSGLQKITNHWFHGILTWQCSARLPNRIKRPCDWKHIRRHRGPRENSRRHETNIKLILLGNIYYKKIFILIYIYFLTSWHQKSTRKPGLQQKNAWKCHQWCSHDVNGRSP